MKAPLKKIFLARYVLLLEIGGYLALGGLIAGIVYSTFYMVDDACKVNADAAVTPQIETIALERPSYVREVQTEYGALVEKGQPLLTVSAHSPASDRLVAVRRSLEEARKALDAGAKTPDVPPGLSELVRRATEDTDAIRSMPTTTVVSPISGEVTPANKEIKTLRSLAGTVLDGPVAQVRNYSTLRFSVAISGKNADRVRINQIAADDVLNWKNLTGKIKAQNPPESPAERRVWERLKGKLADVKPNRTPTKNKKSDIVQALVEILEAADFFDPKIWNPSQLGKEAQSLIQKGVPNLTFEERVRLNRLIFENTFPDDIAQTRNQRQPVKAKILVNQPPLVVAGKEEAQEPKVFLMTGEVISERQSGNVTVEFHDPVPELVAYLKECAADSTKAAPSFRGSIVVDRISAFRFLFRKD